MKLARKLTAAIVLGVFAVLAVHAYFGARRELRLFESDMRRDTHIMGRALAAAVVEVWRSDGRERALHLVDAANERESHMTIRWIALDAPEGDPYAPTLPRARLGPVEAGEEVVAKIDLDGQGEHLVTVVPAHLGSARTGAIEFAESLAGERQYVRTTLVNTAAATLVVALVCGAVASAVGVWLVGRPMRSLIAQATRVGAGDLSQRLDLGQRDEIGELAAEMNAMCDHLAEAHERVAREAAARIAALEQLRHADRLATVGKLASGVAHELGAPLQVISGRARMLADGDAAGAEVAEYAGIIVEQAQRVTRIVRQLLDFARRRGAEKANVDLGAVVRRACVLLVPMADKRRIAVAVEPGDADVVAEVDPDQLQQALTNLVVNAIQASGDGSVIKVTLSTEPRSPPAEIGGAEGRFACLAVEDAGAGMSSETMAHAFEPFFTTKGAGEGTGLGLSVAYGIVRDHGGWIDVASTEGAGARFAIYLPLGGSPPTAA